MENTEENSLICHDNMGICRSEMPQIPDDYVHSFVQYVKNNNIPVYYDDKFPVGMVSLTQKNINLDKVSKIIYKMSNGHVQDENAQFIISDEGYLLDGHHRFLSKVYSGCSHIRVVRVVSCITKIIDLAHNYIEGISDDRF